VSACASGRCAQGVVGSVWVVTLARGSAGIAGLQHAKAKGSCPFGPCATEQIRFTLRERIAYNCRRCRQLRSSRLARP